MQSESPNDAFSERERTILAAFADAVMPPGGLFPGGGLPRTIDRLQDILLHRGGQELKGYKAF